MSLQGLSGPELCEQIKRNEALAQVPVMFLSAGQIPDIIRRRDGRQASYYLRKPFAREVLAELVEQSIGAPRQLVESAAGPASLPLTAGPGSLPIGVPQAQEASVAY